MGFSWWNTALFGEGVGWHLSIESRLEQPTKLTTDICEQRSQPWRIFNSLHKAIKLLRRKRWTLERIRGKWEGSAHADLRKLESGRTAYTIEQALY